MGKKKKWTKKRKILTFVLVLIIAIIAFNILKPKQVEEEKIETEAVQKRNIAQSITATGVISTDNTKSVTTTLTGMEIKTVNVTEGQQISVGDVICTFDTSDVQYNLAVTQDNRNLSVAQSNIGTQGAQRNLDDAVKERDEKTEKVDRLQKTMDGANVNFKNAQAKLQAESPALTAEVSKLTTELQGLQADEKNIQTQIDAINSPSTGTVSGTGAGINSGATIVDLENKLGQIQESIINKQSELNTKQSTLNSLQAEVTKWEAGYNNAVATYDLEKGSLDGLNKQVASLQDQVTSSQINTSMANNSPKTQIKSMQDQIADGIVKSTVNGTVTKVNVKAGDIYTGSAIAVIDGCEDFIVEAEIDEYDIPDVKVGMKVLIKTDATRQEELEGRIIYTAPSATQAATLNGMTTGTTGGAATYTVKIALDTPNDRLRLGMNAKLSIITDSRDDVWSVPFEAVYEREDGSHYIEILKNPETEEKQEITVEKGLEGTYYVEIISNELNGDMQVVLPKIEAGNSLEDLIQMMGPDAGL